MEHSVKFMFFREVDGLECEIMAVNTPQCCAHYTYSEQLVLCVALHRPICDKSTAHSTQLCPLAWTRPISQKWFLGMQISLNK